MDHPTDDLQRTDDYAGQTAGTTLDRLGVDADRGLSETEAQTRLARFGYNEIEEKEESLWHRVFRRFWGPIPWMIEVAAILSAAAGKWQDFGIILVLLLVNAGLDFFQEHRALSALKALKQRLANEVLVRRDGAFATLPARELVPGDVVKLRLGNIVPADVQLLDGDYLLLDQSALTGESLPVSKSVDDVAYANTIVRQGEMLAVVVNTGAHTNFHTVVALVAEASLDETSHFQKMVIRIGNFLILLTVALVVLIVVVSLLRHEHPLEIVRFALVLTVAAIPVALPAVLSVTLAVGALNLARREAIVSRLTAIEELAGVDVFCSDKTGTLTRNEMRVAEPVVFPGHTEEELFLVAALASRIENRDPIERPIFQYLEEHFPEADQSSYRQDRFTPFDPVRKRTEAEVEKDGERFVAVKGAAQVLLDMSKLSEDRAVEVRRSVDRMATRGFRTLAVGRRPGRPGDGPLDLVGLVPLYDPPRDDSKQVIADMRDHGVDVKMLTGDNLAIAREIGQMLGLGQRTVASGQLTGTGDGERPGSHQPATVEAIESVDIFAEVVPEDKFRIVETLQKGEHIVGMTGDGVNDAPALKKADCGIAVSSATDAARAAADIILTSPGLGVINEGLKQARITFERMKSYSLFRIAETIRIILFMTASIVLFNFYPITALMIILLALLNDLPILTIAYDHTKVNDKPVRWNMRQVLSISSVLGLAGVVASFLLFFILRKYGFAENLIQTMLFLKLIVAGHSTVYVTRSEGWFWQRPFPSPLLLGATFGTEILATLIAVYGWLVTPIGWKYALAMWAYALVWFLFNDLVKVWTKRLLSRWYEQPAAATATVEALR